jgi:signal transduction histidine kinase
MRSLTLKLIAAFLLVSVTGTALVALLAVLFTAAQFDRFVADQMQEALAERLAEYYQNNGSWDGLGEGAPQWLRANTGQGRNFQGGLRQFPGQALPILLVDSERNAVNSGLGLRRGDQVSGAIWRSAAPIEFEGQEVGRLFVARDGIRGGLAAAELLFLNRVNRAVILGTLGATIVALLLGIFLARTLTRPIRELTRATGAVAQGDLDQQVPVRSEDELGQLAVSFNQMNTKLAQARDLRRQMTADIAHDLRTPLSIILGHAEALKEGVLPPTQQTFNVIHDESVRLSRLIDDLRILSLADSGELALTLRPVSPGSILERASRAYAPRVEQQNIRLSIQQDDDLPDLLVDADRIAQVMDNLLENALHHTPEFGQISLRAASQDEMFVLIEVHNSGLGISSDELPFIFDRFYRGERSRRRHNEGGSGLGLAIAKSIVEVHRGRIWAESEPGRGVRFILSLPTVD